MSYFHSWSDNRESDFNVWVDDDEYVSIPPTSGSNEPPKKAGALFQEYSAKSWIFVNIALGLKTTMKSCSPTPNYK